MSDPEPETTAADPDATQVVDVGRPHDRPVAADGRSTAAAGVEGSGSSDVTQAMPLGAADLGERTQVFVAPPVPLEAPRHEARPDPMPRAPHRRRPPWSWALWATLAAALGLALLAWLSAEDGRPSTETTTSTTTAPASTTSSEVVPDAAAPPPTAAEPTPVPTAPPATDPPIVQPPPETSPSVLELPGAPSDDGTAGAAPGPGG